MMEEYVHLVISGASAIIICAIVLTLISIFLFIALLFFAVIVFLSLGLI